MRIHISRQMLKTMLKVKCPECKCRDFELIHGNEDLNIEEPPYYLWCTRCSLDYEINDGLLHKRWKQGEYTG